MAWNACGGFPGGTVAGLSEMGETGYLADGVEETLKKLKQIPGIDRSRCRRWAEERFWQGGHDENNYLSVYEKVLELERHRARHAGPPLGDGRCYWKRQHKVKKSYCFARNGSVTKNTPIGMSTGALSAVVRW